MVGASGAIAGVLGAYLVWFPWSRVKTLVFLGIFFTMTELPAPLFLVLWFVVQFFSGTLALATAQRQRPAASPSSPTSAVSSPGRAWRSCSGAPGVCTPALASSVFEE